MQIFVSHSSRDREETEEIIRHLRSKELDVWFDQDLRGGEVWWSEILRQVESSSLLLLVTSDNSLRSRPCLAEIEYARRLGLPILPVLIDAVSTIRTEAISDLQTIDYDSSESSTGSTLLSAIKLLTDRAGPLPDPLPSAPPTPYAYLNRLGTRVGAAELEPTEQIGLVAELRYALHQESEPSVHQDLIALLHRLRERSDITRAAWEQADRVFRDWSLQKSVPPVVDDESDGPGVWPPGWYMDPEGSKQRRWYDGIQWTMTFEAEPRTPDSQLDRRSLRHADWLVLYGIAFGLLGLIPGFGLLFGGIAVGLAAIAKSQGKYFATESLCCAVTGFSLGLIFLITLSIAG